MNVLLEYDSANACCQKRLVVAGSCDVNTDLDSSNRLDPSVILRPPISCCELTIAGK
jgi:hypothetical protein